MNIKFSLNIITTSGTILTLASSCGNVMMKCSVRRVLSSITCLLSLELSFRAGPRPTGYSPVAACFTQQTMISIRLVSCRSSMAENERGVKWGRRTKNTKWRVQYKEKKGSLFTRYGMRNFSPKYFDELGNKTDTNITSRFSNSLSLNGGDQGSVRGGNVARIFCGNWWKESK